MAQAPSSQTLVYKRIAGVNIELELYLPQSQKNVPVLLWFHGGGLLQGHRKALCPHMLRGIEKHGYALASADCKLATYPLDALIAAVTRVSTSS